MEKEEIILAIGMIPLFIGILWISLNFNRRFRMRSNQWTGIFIPSVLSMVGLGMLLCGILIPRYSEAQLNILKSGDWNEWRESNPSVAVDLEEVAASA